MDLEAVADYAGGYWQGHVEDWQGQYEDESL